MCDSHQLMGWSMLGVFWHGWPCSEPSPEGVIVCSCGSESALAFLTWHLTIWFSQFSRPLISNASPRCFLSARMCILSLCCRAAQPAGFPHWGCCLTFWAQGVGGFRSHSLADTAAHYRSHPRTSLSGEIPPLSCQGGCCCCQRQETKRVIVY